MVRPPPPWLPAFACPDCERRFMGAVGLKIHRGRVHRVLAGRRSETVTAAQLRPDDVLITNVGDLLVTDVDHSDASVSRLRSNGRWWSVPSATKFVRVKRSRKIEMRPDLNKEDA